MSYLEMGFSSWTKAKDSPYRIRDALARVSGSERIDPWSDRAGPPMWIKNAWTLRFPALWGVNEPMNDSIGPGSSDLTEAPRNSNNHISQTRQGVQNHWRHL